MKKEYQFRYAVMLLIAMAWGCGSSDNKEKVEVDVADIPGARNITEQMDAHAKRQAERKEKGDTLAMPYTTLQTYLPDISGYQKDGGPEGSQMNVPGMGSWAQVSQRFSNGDKQIEVNIFDYNGSVNAFTGATALYSMGISQEDDQKKSQTSDMGVNGVAAYETVYKTEPRAELILIVMDRFMIQLESEGSSDIELLKNAARNMKLEDLAGR